MLERSRRSLPAALAASAACLAALPAGASAFGGAALLRPSAGVGLTYGGIAYPRVSCAGGTEGFCHGTVTIRRGGRLLGRAPLAIRSGDAPSVEVPLRGGRRDSILRAGRAVTVTISVWDHSESPSHRTSTAHVRLKG